MKLNETLYTLLKYNYELCDWLGWYTYGKKYLKYLMFKINKNSETLVCHQC